MSFSKWSSVAPLRVSSKCKVSTQKDKKRVQLFFYILKVNYASLNAQSPSNVALATRTDGKVAEPAVTQFKS